MITRNDIIDAIGKLVADLGDGTWGLNNDCMHPAIVELMDRLPADPAEGGRPLFVDVEPGTVGNYVGYRIGLNLDRAGRPEHFQAYTIAAVDTAPAGTSARVYLVETPGYYLLMNPGDRQRVHAPIDATPPPVAEHPDLIDCDGDTWRWYEGYDTIGADHGLWTREQVERVHGPVRVVL